MEKKYCTWCGELKVPTETDFYDESTGLKEQELRCPSGLYPSYTKGLCNKSMKEYKLKSWFPFF